MTRGEAELLFNPVEPGLAIDDCEALGALPLLREGEALVVD